MSNVNIKFHDRSDKVQHMTNTKQENNMIDRTGSIYLEIEIELSKSIRQDAIYHENRHDNDVTDRISVIS